MTEEQKKYYNAMKKLGSKKPQKPIPRPQVQPLGSSSCSLCEAPAEGADGGKIQLVLCLPGCVPDVRLGPPAKRLGLPAERGASL